MYEPKDAAVTEVKVSGSGEPRLKTEENPGGERESAESPAFAASEKVREAESTEMRNWLGLSQADRTGLMAVVFLRSNKSNSPEADKVKA